MYVDQEGNYLLCYVEFVSYTQKTTSQYGTSVPYSKNKTKTKTKQTKKDNAD